MNSDTDLRLLVGHNIVLARHLADLSQSEAARRLRIPRTRLADWERGRYKPNDRNLSLIADVVGQEFAWFYVERRDGEEVQL